MTKAKDTGSGRPLLDKLGVKAGARVVLLDIEDGRFEALLGQRTKEVHRRPLADADLIFFGAAQQRELGRLAELRRLIKDDGAIWVVRPKGIPGGLSEPGIIEAALANGLVDNKVVSFSDTHSALRLVIPVSQRGPARR